MQQLLLSVTPNATVDDCWFWTLDAARGFIVKRCYAWLCDFFVGGRVVVADQQRAMWLKLWKNNAPSKILMFAWSVLIFW